MFIIKRIDTNTSSSYEFKAYATMHDVQEQLTKLGAGNEDNFDYAVESWSDAPDNTLIFTTSNSRGHIFEVRTLGLYGYSSDSMWKVAQAITALKGDERAISFIYEFAKRV